MGTWRRPKGSYVRNTADWYIQQSACVGGYYNDRTHHGVIFDLYNNAQDGSSLHLYEMWLSSDGQDNSPVYPVSGHAATLLSNSFPIVIGHGGLPGQLYYDLIPAITIPLNTASAGAYIVADVSALWLPMQAPGPLQVIPPGYSLRFRVDWNDAIASGGSIISASYYWTVIRDQG